MFHPHPHPNPLPSREREVGNILSPGGKREIRFFLPCQGREEGIKSSSLPWREGVRGRGKEPDRHKASVNGTLLKGGLTG